MIVYSAIWRQGRSVLLRCLLPFLSVILTFIPITSAKAQPIINELMYHPYDVFGVTNETEYVELYNAGTNTVDLSIYRFDNGIDYAFPFGTMLATGKYLVVCENIVEFTNAYPDVTNYVGNYNGSLNNGGERVTLSCLTTGGWITADTIKYVDIGASDGDNPSLELVHPGFARLRNMYPGSWAVSTASGTPGTVNSVYTNNPPPVVGDVEHKPLIPPANSTVTISARVTSRDSDVLAEVLLQYRIDALPQGEWLEVPMHDNGLNGDETANDGTYTRQLPPYGDPTFTGGQILEFRITATGTNGVSMPTPAPFESWSGVLTGPYSYLCYFGEDTAYNGEYVTYHMLMTTSNKTIVEAQGQFDDGVRLDGTLITSDGEIFYNCGFRHRGGSSTYAPFNYKVRFPTGRNLDGLTSFDLNHISAMYQYIGMKIMGDIGYGVEAPKVKLCRLWLNEIHKTPLATAEANHKMYVRHEAPMDQDFAKSHYGSDYGNFYFTDGDTYGGTLTYLGDINSYKTLYNAVTNYPPMAWRDMSNFCWTVDQAPSMFPTILTNRLDPREWGRYFGGQMALDNQEAGVNAPPGGPNDELRLYSGFENGIFRIIPHDCDLILQANSSDVWGWNGYNTSDVIENEPTVKFYRHDCLDIASNVMSDANMNAMFDEIGSAAATFRAGWLNNIRTQRGQIQAILGVRDAGPTAPTNMVLTNVTAITVGIQWQDVGSDEEWFEIWRSKEGGAWKYRAYVEANVTSYVDRGLDENTTYSYKVRAVDQHGESPFTSPQSATTPYATTTDLLIENLRITEIMYNPGTNANDSTHEFIELKNIGSTPLNLTGLYLDNGRFAFTNNTILGTNAFFVIANNAAGFTNWYPAAVYNGVFQTPDNLNNGGETLWIKDSLDNRIIEVTYDDIWYLNTDGEGYSLVLADPEGTPNDPKTSDMSDPDLWRSSTNPRGSPGADDPPPLYGVIVINEALTHQDVENPGDWIELYNPSTNNINIGDWYLSDNATNLTKFHIASGTIITAQTYKVFTEWSHFGTNAIGANGFALSELGEEIYLSSASGTNLTNYRISKDFGASDNGVTFGRYVKSDNDSDFVAMISPTYGATNSYPLVGPVVINEIMYNPAAGGKEYIELYNLTSSNVPLFNAETPTNTWTFNGAVEYTFPSNTWMAPNEYILIVSIDTNVFRNTFGITNTVRIFGPFSDELDNAGESVKLYKPGNIETNFFVPRILVDRVKYDDASPWPVAADNGGMALERITPASYGNDPTNWNAMTYGGTPGTTNNALGLPSIAFEDNHNSSYETNAIIYIPVSLAPGIADTVTVSYAISGGTATNGLDYIFTPGVLTFEPYVTSNSIPLTISNDVVVNELDETVLITIYNQSPNTLLGGNQVYTHTIIDTDASGLAAPTILPTSTTFYKSIALTMTTTVANASIYYTTDGSIPTMNDKLYTGIVTITKSKRIKAKTFRGSYNCSTLTSQLYTHLTDEWEFPPGTIELRVNASNNDYDEKIQNDRNGIITNTTIEIGRDAYNKAGFRFADVPIPKGATISNAYIRFTSVYANTNDTVVYIYAEATNDASPFVQINGDIGNRNLTSNSVTWSPSIWQAEESELPECSPSLTNMIQEVISRPGWTISNALAVIIYYDAVYRGNRFVYAWDGDPLKSAVLHIEYVLDLAIDNSTGASGVGISTATLNGNLTSCGGQPNASVIVYWGPADGVTNKLAWSNAIPMGALTTGSFATNVTGLTSNTTYYYRCFASNASGSAWAAVSADFTTLAPCAINNTAGATAVGVTSATLNGNVTSTGGAPTIVYVYWGPADGNTDIPSWSNAISMGQKPVGAFFTNLAGLASATLYYYRCFASNAFSTAWAPVTSNFTTLAAIPPVIDNDGGASNITATAAILNGYMSSTGNTPTVVWVYWGTSDGMTDAGSWATNKYFGLRSVGLISTNISDLLPATTYYYRSAASNTAGIVWADVTIYNTPSATSNGTPYVWLSAYGLTDYDNDDNEDQDSDGMVTWQEYKAGTNPTNALSVLAITAATNTTGNFFLQWLCVTGKTYYVYKSTNLVSGWILDPLTNLPGDASGTNEYNDPDASGARAFYQIRIEY